VAHQHTGQRRVFSGLWYIQIRLTAARHRKQAEIPVLHLKKGTWPEEQLRVVPRVPLFLRAQHRPGLHGDSIQWFTWWVEQLLYWPHLTF
jgi:hypothetical protein